jgi:DNA-directed RNA polymerase subunit RPC12/RpoP
MQLELQCKKCEESFDVDAADIAVEPEIRCPGCGAKATVEQAESLGGALEDLFAAVAALRRKFTVTGELDSDDLPAPYDEEGTAGVRRAKAPLLDEEEEDDDDQEEEEP